MRILFLLFFFALPKLAISQVSQELIVNDSLNSNDHGWEKRIAYEFYRRISDGRKFECCEPKKKSKAIAVTIDLPSQCYARTDFNLEKYSEECVDSATILAAVNSLDLAYRRRFSENKRKLIARSCYSTYITETVVEDLAQDVVFISGQLKIVICFQLIDNKKTFSK